MSKATHISSAVAYIPYRFSKDILFPLRTPASSEDIMKRIVILLAIVLMIPALFASAVYVQLPASDDEPRTRTELEALLDEHPGFHKEFPSRSSRQSIKRQTISHAPGISGTADAVRHARKVCDARIGTPVLGRLVYGVIEHSALMEVQNGRFTGIASVPQDTNFDFTVHMVIGGFSVYSLRGWSDDPYNRRDGSDGWVLGSYVTVRARILSIDRDIVNHRDLYCKITLRQ